MKRPIRKAVFPVAGLGTRFLPATKAMPKEMLTVVDRPLIQIVVDEAREAGIEHLIFVTGRNKGVIEDHFDKQYELENTLRKRDRTIALDMLEQDLPGAGQTSFTRQQEPLGLGHAIWCARNIVGDEPFAVLLPDMVSNASPGCMKQMVDIYNNSEAGNIVAVEEAPWDQVHRYGVVKPSAWQGDHFEISQMVEKPKDNALHSNLIISGRYILQPEIFQELDCQEPGVGGEIQITDAMIRLMSRQAFRGYKFAGEVFDCGDRIGFLEANLAFALGRKELSATFKASVERILQQHGGRISWDETKT